MSERVNRALLVILLFVVRWALMSFGLWIAVRLFGHEKAVDLWTSIATFLLAGLVFSAANAIVKPILTFLSLPFILVTLGIFILVINGLMVYLTVNLVPNISMSFSGAIVSGLVLSMINYLISNLNEWLENYHSQEGGE
ncbi:MAG: phage holin family protein [Candidatus Nanoperiomorbaceae bacterium]